MGHEEVRGHTMYSLSCALRPPRPPGEGPSRPGAPDPSSERLWRVHRRLEQLRDDLHDYVKSELGEAYGRLFAATPFASRGGLPGTTAKLNAWVGTLAAVVNGGPEVGAAPVAPTLVAFVLSFLDAPALDDSSAFDLMPAHQIAVESPTAGIVGYTGASGRVARG
mmetsp:Transcript_35734/g.99899  ORF Transcript_35734/g.99899 Transcript_35734/m.99899 type:complete len:165 (+) Transcript_35734:1-495(+)